MIKYSIILIGYMGVGKSYIGRKLSEELKMDFFDLDNYIELSEKQSISNIEDLASCVIEIMTVLKFRQKKTSQKDLFLLHYKQLPNFQKSIHLS